MNITVEYFGQLCELTGKNEEIRNISEGRDVIDLIYDLAETYGETFAAIVTDGAGGLRPSVLVVLDGNMVSTDADRNLRSGSVVKLLTAIAGG